MAKKFSELRAKMSAKSRAASQRKVKKILHTIPARTTQSSRILAALQAGRRLSPIEALDEFGCLRLAARILDLREAGHDIRRDVMRERGKPFAVYYLVVPEPAPREQLGLFPLSARLRPRC